MHIPLFLDTLYLKVYLVMSRETQKLEKLPTGVRCSESVWTWRSTPWCEPVAGAGPTSWCSKATEQVGTLAKMETGFPVFGCTNLSDMASCLPTLSMERQTFTSIIILLSWRSGTTLLLNRRKSRERWGKVEEIFYKSSPASVLGLLHCYHWWETDSKYWEQRPQGFQRCEGVCWRQIQPCGGCHL